MLDLLVLVGCVVVIGAVVIAVQLRRRNPGGPVADNPGDDYTVEDREHGGADPGGGDDD